MSSKQEKPARLSMGIMTRLQESTRRNVDDVFGDIMDPSAPPKPAAPAPVPAFRALAEELPQEPAPAPVATMAEPSAELVAVASPAHDPGEPAPPAPAGGEGERRASPVAKSTKPPGRSPKGVPCAAHPGESKRENLVSVRFTPEQMEDLEHWSEAERLQLAVMCRDLILKEMNRNRALIQKIREFRQGLTRSA